ncbi:MULTISPECIES: YjcZ family sporulation protein [unclassified Bacillus (in: firmicutes)]|nr:MULTISPECIES: YjcZ family sporulation protein [unclassified Bacillus (in: firmicutes)]MBT2655818.1 YjcZ family sporulation protein [Bacillus sp. ISL-18]MBT2658087.1 YjcZ family sporulation protein [Bacillus sp. ISL-18]MBT2736613.1 YjcZ family sporulation protein [Bacillus sp. ISL-7]
MSYQGGGMGTSFALIVVLFILLIIVGASFMGGGY